jgi:hypothetical protein
VIYLDSAAVVKLVHPEAESLELQLWLTERAGMTRVSSQLVEVEVARAILRHAPGHQSHVPMILASLARFEIDQAVRTVAASYSDPSLRSLDAIHLATAQIITAELGEPLEAFVTYDKRLLEVARAAGFRVACPGA